MSNNLLIELTDRYLNGDMTDSERMEFEKLRQSNAEINSRIDQHIQFTQILKNYGKHQELKDRMNAIHDGLDVQAMANEVVERPTWIVQLWRNHHSKISVAASIAIFAILGTLFFSGYFAGKSETLELKKDQEQTKNQVKHLANSISPIIQDIKNSPKFSAASRFSGTGFAISSNGYLVTNYHVIKDNDSLYVQNSAGEAYHSRVIYADAKYDVAVLKIDDPAFKNLGALPYNFKKAKSDLGENVYTAGFPADSLVCGRGYLASQADLHGDTLNYEISIPVNPGNSGGPLWDASGNIIGIIHSRSTQLEGAAFAVKSRYLLKAIQSIPADSLNNTKLAANNSHNALAGLSWPQQIKKMQNYVFMIKVYKD